MLEASGLLLRRVPRAWAGGQAAPDLKRVGSAGRRASRHPQPSGHHRPCRQICRSCTTRISPSPRRCITAATSAVRRWISAGSTARTSPTDNVAAQLAGCDGIIVPGGFGDRGIEGMITAAKYCPRARHPLSRHLPRHADSRHRICAPRLRPRGRKLRRVQQDL